MLRVLVIDPRASFLRKLTVGLESACDLTAASTTASVEDFTSYDLVVLSLLQAEDDGLILASSLRASSPDLCVAVYGAGGGRPLLDAWRKDLERQHGLFAYLAASIPAGETAVAVSSWIRRIEATRRAPATVIGETFNARIRPQEDSIRASLNQEIGMEVIDKLSDNPSWGDVLRARPSGANIRRILGKELTSKD